MARSVSGNLGAFLDMLAASEIGAKLLASSDDGYNVIVGGALFHNGYVDHPRILVDLPRLGIKSTAAGRYQLLMRYFDAYKNQLGLTDFSPASQDAIALQQIKEQGAYRAIQSGLIHVAIERCANIWASLPGAGYGQHEQEKGFLVAAYRAAGGMVNIA